MATFEDFEPKRLRLDGCDKEGGGEVAVDGDKKESGEEVSKEEEEKIVEENDSEESENEDSESESEKITENEWEWARDKCRETIARQVAKKWGVSNVSDADLDEFIQRKIDWMDYKMDKYEFQFVEEKLLNKCCRRLGFGGGILNNYTILSFALAGRYHYY
jgi:hypothetical protein